MSDQADEPQHKLPPDPQTRPEEAVDALEEEVLGETSEQSRDENDSDEAAFEQDFDTSDPGRDLHEPEEPSG